MQIKHAQTHIDERERRVGLHWDLGCLLSQSDTVTTVQISSLVF